MTGSSQFDVELVWVDGVDGVEVAIEARDAPAAMTASSDLMSSDLFIVSSLK
jgi:hypothetical protein